MPLEKAAEESINTAFVDLTSQMKDGNAKVIEAAKEAGVSDRWADNYKPDVLGTPLGYAPVSPVDMANAYATIAASGKKADWYVIEKVTSKNGVEHQHKVATEQTIPADVAADTIAALRGVVSKGTGTRGRTVCTTGGKTGTATAGSRSRLPRLLVVVHRHHPQDGNGRDVQPRCRQ